MTSRDWFCLALRVLGVWQLSNVIPYLATLIPSFANASAFGGFEYLVSFLWIAATTGVGLFLLLFAPAVAIRLYPNTAAEAQQPTAELPDRLLEVGLRLLGAYLLVLAVHTLTTYVANALYVAFYSNVSWRDQIAASGPRELISTGVYVTLGLIILVGPKRIVAALDRLRYNAERDAYAPPPIPGRRDEKD